MAMMIFAKLISFYILLTLTAHAKVHDYQTARMKSTGGAGVGSILMNEAAVFNPAPIAFFQESAIYLQKSDFRPQENSAEINGRLKSDDNDTFGVIVADGKNGIAGAFSYQSQEEAPFSRKRFSTGFGHKINDTSSAGFGYSFTHDYSNENTKGEKHHQFTAGSSHVVNDNLTLGIVYIDPLATVPEDSRAQFGFQWFIKSFIALMGDLGADYRRGMSETLVYRGAIQLSFFQDFYIRAGLFDDNALGEKGNGVGVSWIGPKLQIDISMKDSKPNGESPKAGVIPSDFTETTMALSYRF